MIYCPRCNEVFEQTKRYRTYQSSPDDLPEEWDGCPYCGCDAVVDVHQCSVCGEYFATGIYIKAIGEYVCDQCYERVSE